MFKFFYESYNAKILQVCEKANEHKFSKQSSQSTEKRFNVALQGRFCL